VAGWQRFRTFGNSTFSHFVATVPVNSCTLQQQLQGYVVFLHAYG
jgi:hypothetical protein